MQKCEIRGRGFSHDCSDVPVWRPRCRRCSVLCRTVGNVIITARVQLHPPGSSPRDHKRPQTHRLVNKTSSSSLLSALCKYVTNTSRQTPNRLLTRRGVFFFFFGGILISEERQKGHSALDDSSNVMFSNSETDLLFDCKCDCVFFSQ